MGNRCCAFRIPSIEEKNMRIENRIPGSDTNPYLVFAANLASGYLGIKNNIKPTLETKNSAFEDIDPSIPKNIDESLKFFCDGLGLKETRRMENEKGRFTLVFLAAQNDEKAEIELTYNWDGDELGEGSRNFGHLAYRVDNIYETCQRLMDMGYTINRPPRDGHMAFVRSPDKISIEILQEGNLEPKEPWASMKNTGSW